MRPLIQKLPLNESSSFIAQTFRTPEFEVGWHQHIEYELILFTEGSGLSLIGNHVGQFETGDIYFLGSNVPHTFRKRDPDLVTSAVVVQFRRDFWGQDLLQLPEARKIRQLLETSMQGLKLQGQLRNKMQTPIKELEKATGFRRVIALCHCLELMAANPEWTTVNTQELRINEDERISRIFQFTIDNFRDPITLQDVAEIACMSVPHFCSFFKRCTQKTYVDFLNTVRTGYACSLLTETQKPVLDICFESGYNTIANFHKQFLKTQKLTPLQYRKAFAPEVIRQGRNIGIEA
ncbi:AraC family transcriptional regulator [Niabella drilacis]|uniref:AraC-type DNA-binding protein n=1 Tax=Niabella drilacis (strain DSM 25811 / CCM 8410 / CCUG 62505 / LMG 26954 / E90) TaxID=1285928 RepID=A0A1G6X4Q7_NIADE|nr:AraC family transcriptional regulator [Niabella drilacis]SDD73024.1 AraC-type DNA-binding protein [Niabella drilacis]